MRFRGLIILPLLYAVVFIAIALWADADNSHPFVLLQKILVRLLAIIGSIWAVSAFERGDHLRRAWQWLALAASLVLVRDLIVLPSRLAGSTQPLAGILGIVVIALAVASNVGLLSGVWLLSRSWKMAALTLPGGHSRVIMVTVIAAAIAFAVAGPPLLQDVPTVVGGDPTALINVVSTVVDILSLTLLAQLLLTAVALRDGDFFWPWALLSACLVSWLLYDAASNYELAPGGFPLAEVFRGLALNFQLTAGLAQAMVIRRVRQEAG